ncbi:MAG: TonB-dependent receptor [Balneolales bacterium]
MYNLTDVYGQQEMGVVSGKIIDRSTEEPLIGANIIINGTTRGTVSDRNGNFRIRRVPEGVYSLRASYLGYQSEEQEVNVESGDRVYIDFFLGSTLIEGEEVVVSGILRGQSRALQKQRAAPSSRRIVSSEIMDQHGDDNIIGTIGRLPGARLRYDEGDRVTLTLRGVGIGGINVTMDGMTMGANTGGRGTDLSAFSADMIESLEIINAQTPDMDAGSLSGTINLVTRPITTREADWRIRGRNDYGFMPDRSEQMYYLDPRFSIRYRQQVSENIGVQIQGDFRQRTRDADKLDVAWMTIGPDADGIWSDDGDAMFMPDSYRPTNELVKTQQYNFNSTVTYSHTENSWFYLRGMMSERQVHDQYRIRERPTFGRGEVLDVSDEGDIVTVTNYRIDSEYRRYDETSGNSQFSIGGESLIWDDQLQMDFSLGWATGYGFEDNRWQYDFRNDEVDALTEIRMIDGQIPQVSLTKEARDPAKSHFRQVTRDEEWSRDNNYIADLNFKIRNIGFLDGSFKYGGNFRHRNQADQPERYRYDWNGFGNLTQDQFIMENVRRSDNTVTPDWEWGHAFDEEEFHDFFIANYNSFEFDVDSYAQRFDTRTENYESVYSAYVMPEVKFGRAHLIGGVRMEATHAKTTGLEVIMDRRRQIQELNRATANVEYLDFFPSVHLNYSLMDHLLGRISFSTGLQRPGFSDWTPGFSEDQSRERLTVGNPNLEPQYASKFEFQLEQYLSDQLGYISVGVFYMDITNMITELRESIIIDSEVFDFEGFEDYEGWELRRPINIEESFNTGVEVVWQQQLTFLPGRLSHLGINSNYTYIYSEVEMISPIERTARASNLPPHELNLSLNYEAGRFFGQISGLYMSRHIERYHRDDFIYNGVPVYFDTYENTTFRLDASFNFRISSNIRLNADAVNLLNRPYRDRYYQQFLGAGVTHPDMFYRIGEGGVTGSVGLQINF